MARHARVIFLLTFWIAAGLGVRADDLEGQLKHDYLNHLLGVRYHFHDGEQTFDSSGKPIWAGGTAPWEIYGAIQVQKVSLSSDQLRVEGPRIAFADMKDLSRLITIGKTVQFAIALDHPLTSMDEARAVMESVFYTDQTDLDHLKPEYRRRGADLTVDAVFEAGGLDRGTLRPEYVPEPEFSKLAREKRAQGTVFLNILVDKTGNVVTVRVDRALGYDLDETAVAAVETWRFKPATRNGEVVSVRFNVQVDFRLGRAGRRS